MIGSVSKTNRAEATRVVWPSRRETLITTLMVVALAVAASLFLLVVDEGLRILVSLDLSDLLERLQIEDDYLSHVAIGNEPAAEVRNQGYSVVAL